MVFARNIALGVLLAAVSSHLVAQTYEKLGQGQNYFPKAVFAEDKSDGDFVAGWYSSQLRAMKEPSLFTASSVICPIRIGSQ